MSLTLTLHRGAHEIGGSCIEIASPAGERLILDAGRPLDAPKEATGLLPGTLDRSRPATVLISHPHQDHWGLVDELPPEWPVLAGRASVALMQVTADLFGTPRPRVTPAWDSRSAPFAIGGFTVTPMLIDHSAFDAYMLLIEGFGRRILYSGDFRGHGRKARLTEALMAHPPAHLDVLLMEGTNLHTAKPVMHEADLERDFADLARRTGRHVFVNWSAQNIDRTVTLYRAAKRTGRRLVVDLYTADVLTRIAEGTGVPQPGWPLLEVIVTAGLARRYEASGRANFVTAMARGGFGTSARRVASGPPAIIMLRDALLRDQTRGGLTLGTEDAYAFSNWRGYLDEADPRTAWARAQAAGAEALHLHTSGHASPALLSAFARAMKPRALVPVHGVRWDDPGIDLPPVRRLADGEAWRIA